MKFVAGTLLINKSATHCLTRYILRKIDLDGNWANARLSPAKAPAKTQMEPTSSTVAANDASSAKSLLVLAWHLKEHDKQSIRAIDQRPRDVSRHPWQLRPADSERWGTGGVESRHIWSP